MWYKEIGSEVLRSAATWKIERYREDLLATALKSASSRRIGDLVRVREETADPAMVPYDGLPYLGLDAVESGTGEILFLRSASEQSIRSRSKVFRAGDVLYGRLRAYLNKVAVVGATTPLGTCSGEFYVLIPDDRRVNPLFLQWALSSEAMVAYVTLRLAGATHPRLALEDLLDFHVDLPTLDEQEAAAAIIANATNRRRTLLEELRLLPSQVTSQVKVLMSGG